MFSDDIKRKRIMNEQLKLKKVKLGFAQIFSNENDPREFHFLLKGHDDSEYKGGYYIGKINLDKDYPSKAGDFMMLTPSGRFQINKKICLSNSAYHQSEHSPLWTIENMVIGMASIFHEEDRDKNGKPKNSISHMYDSKEQRKNYASQTLSYNMENYGLLFTKFDQLIDENGFPKTQITESVESKESEKKEILQDLKSQETIAVDVNNNEPIIISTINNKTDKVIVEIPQKKKNIIKNKDKKTIISNIVLSSDERIDKINKKISHIKNMSYENFDITPYQELNLLLSPLNLSNL